MVLYELETDFAYDEDTFEEAVARFREEIGVDESELQVRVVNANGPGGGWPVVVWSSQSDEVMADVCLAYWGVDRNIAHGNAREAVLFAVGGVRAVKS